MKNRCCHVHQQSEIFTQLFPSKAYLNLSRVFGISSEMPSNSKNYFGFVVDEFSKPVQTVNLTRQDCWARSQKTKCPGSPEFLPNPDRKPHSNLLRVFDVICQAILKIIMASV